MTFTRLSDSVALSPAPLSVFGPFEAEREVRNIAHELLHSSVVKVTFVPLTYRAGTWRLLYATHANASTARTFFASSSYYTYDVADASMDTRFIVHGGALTITQNGLWELTVPYKEVPA